jgi:cysteine-rich repeat protein
MKKLILLCAPLLSGCLFLTGYFRPLDCGDNLVQDGVEECDDGNKTDRDGCSADCIIELCGNNILDEGEACDDANQLDGDGCSALCTIEVPPSCGDGFVNVDGEVCDDGNQTSGDGCNAACQSEICGDGILNNGGSEQCDTADFGGQVCATFGFQFGNLACNACIIDASGCSNPEQCTNGLDDDIDGQIDCNDADCNTACSDACNAPPSIPSNIVITGDTTGHTPSRNSCFGASAGDLSFLVNVANPGTLTFTLSSQVDLGMFIRTDCGDANSELACVNNVGGGNNETFTLNVAGGETFSVIVDGVSGAEGSFTLTLNN